jgi:hypothetical protein
MNVVIPVQPDPLGSGGAAASNALISLDQVEAYFTCCMIPDVTKTSITDLPDTLLKLAATATACKNHDYTTRLHAIRADHTLVNKHIAATAGTFLNSCPPQLAKVFKNTSARSIKANKLTANMYKVKKEVFMMEHVGSLIAYCQLARFRYKSNLSARLNAARLQTALNRLADVPVFR